MFLIIVSLPSVLEVTNWWLHILLQGFLVELKIHGFIYKESCSGPEAAKQTESITQPLSCLTVVLKFLT